MEINWPELRGAATETMRRAYAPYSRYPVGAAALVDDGRVVVGCNVENAAYGVVLCAECGVVSALHASGGGRLVALACVDGAGDPLMPCGRCRQLLWEHGGPECLIDAAPAPLRMAELLPHAFDVTDLDAIGGAGRHDPVVPARLAGWKGRGTVFVHADLVSGERVWTGYWERSDGAFVAEPTGAPVGEATPGALDASPPSPGASPATAPASASAPASGSATASALASGSAPALASGSASGREGLDDGPGILEEAPVWPDAADAVAWGRARTPRVVVIDIAGAALWAGEGEPPAGLTGRWEATS